MIGIYKIENINNNKIYIGQSLDIKRRIRQHLCKKDTLIDCLIQKLGVENFVFSVVEECEVDLLNEREKYWIDYYNSYENGYNRTRGGKGSPDNFIKLSTADVKEIYELLINSNLSQKQIAKLYNVGQDTISEINHGKTRVQSGYIFPLRNNKKDIVQTKKIFYLSKEQLIADFIELKSFSKIGKKYNVSSHPVRNIANKYGFSAKTMKDLFLKKQNKTVVVIQMDMSGNVIKEFSSTREASREMHDRHIKQVCDGKRKSSLGYKYKYKN